MVICRPTCSWPSALKVTSKWQDSASKLKPASSKGSNMATVFHRVQHKASQVEYSNLTGFTADSRMPGDLPSLLVDLTPNGQIVRHFNNYSNRVHVPTALIFVRMQCMSFRHTYLAILSSPCNPPWAYSPSLSRWAACATMCTHVNVHVHTCAHSPECPIHVYIAPVLPASSIKIWAEE